MQKLPFAHIEICFMTPNIRLILSTKGELFTNRQTKEMGYKIKIKQNTSKYNYRQYERRHIRSLFE